MNTMRTRVKICGLTRETDIIAAVEAGADAIGLMLYSGSKRCLTAERAAQLRRLVPAFVSATALFVNASPSAIQAVIDSVNPDLLQFHGDESPEACRQSGRLYLKAFRVGAPGLDTPESLAAHCKNYDDAAGWLFDSYSAGYGGSGLGNGGSIPVEHQPAHGKPQSLVLTLPPLSALFLKPSDE